MDEAEDVELGEGIESKLDLSSAEFGEGVDEGMDAVGCTCKSNGKGCDGYWIPWRDVVKRKYNTRCHWTRLGIIFELTLEISMSQSRGVKSVV